MIIIGVLTWLGFTGGAAPESPPPDQRPAGTEKSTTNTARIRAPAVAGLFYPKRETTLAKMVDEFLAAAPARSLTNLRALICPHAGYEYSGSVAAYAYKTLIGSSFETVIIIGPSHRAAFRGVWVAAVDAYETPLGKVPVSEKAKLLARQSPFAFEPENTPAQWEHSVEVQVPFLQKTLKDFKILPMVYGDADPEKVARALADILDEKTLVVASTDLSHYHPYDEANAMDRRTVKWICDMDIKSLQSPGAHEAACGRMPVLTLMHLAKLKGWTPQLLDYRNSGDTSGDKSRVVGYAAFAFTGPAAKAQETSKSAAEQTPAKVESKPAAEKSGAAFSAAERKFLLDLARQTLKSVTAGGPLPKPDPESIPDRVKESKGCFVTLTKGGQLRGCIGNILPAGPLYQAVMENARSAALRDFRFPPVTPDEVDKIHIEISVLTEPQPLEFKSPEDLLAKLQPHKDGVILNIGGRSATFLPQVWEQLPDKVQFLSHLSQKAGCAPSDWRGRDVSVSIYHVEAFEEAK